MKLIKEVLGYSSGILSRIRRLNRYMRNKPSGFLRALIYHDIAPQHEILFAKQIEYVNKHYQFIDIETFCQMHQEKIPIHNGNVLLTFDDGFKSNRIIAEKYLNPLGIKAIFFVISDFISCDVNRRPHFISQQIFDGTIKESEVPAQLVPMDWDDIHFLLDHGHTIASHSYTHKRLSTISSQNVLEYEIIAGADKLQNELGIPIKYFAFPFGDVNSIDTKVMNLAKIRYEYIFSGIRGNNNNKISPYTIRRDHVEPTFSMRYFHFILEGGLSPYYYSKRKILDKMV